MEIKRQDVEGFIWDISQGRKGNPLSPSSVFAFTKDIRAFINYVADEWSPEEWANPVRRLKCKRPQVFIRPLSRDQLVRLFELAEDTASSQLLTLMAAGRERVGRDTARLRFNGRLGAKLRNARVAVE